MSASLRVGVLGLGSMGRHHVRNARNTEGFELVAVADPGGDRFGVAGSLPVLDSVSAMIEVGIDAAIVAVPTVFHEEAALALAEAGVHALVEKPLAASVESGKRLAEGQLGDVYQVVTRRQSPFPARISDVGVVKDLATHDVDLAAWVAGSEYKEIYAQTAHRSGREHEDMVVASGSFKNGVLVNHLVNWLTPFKDRTTIVTGEHGALVADTAMGDLTFYENGDMPLQWDQIAAFRGVSEGTVTRYALAKREPLAVEHEHFRDAILGKGNEHVSMEEGLNALKVVEGILASAASGQAVHF